MRDIKRRLSKLEGVSGISAEDDCERERHLKMIREEAARQNQSFFRDLAIERRTAYLERVGYGKLSAEELQDHNFLSSDDEPPFEITPDGKVFCTRDGKPVTDFRQTLAEVWYWQWAEWGEGNLIHDEEAQAFYTSTGELALSRTYVNIQHLFEEGLGRGVHSYWPNALQ